MAACPLLLLLAQHRSLQLGQPPTSCAAGAAAAICRRCAARLRRGPRSGKWAERPACGRAKSEGGRLVLGAAGAEQQGRTLPLTPHAHDKRAGPKLPCPADAQSNHASWRGPPRRLTMPSSISARETSRRATAMCSSELSYCRRGGSGASAQCGAAATCVPYRPTAGNQGGAHRVLRAVQQPRSSAWRLHLQTPQPAGPRAYSTQQAAAAMGCATASAPAAAGGRCRPRAAGACSGREACRQGVLRSSGCA